MLKIKKIKKVFKIMKNPNSLLKKRTYLESQEMKTECHENRYNDYSSLAEEQFDDKKST